MEVVLKEGERIDDLERNGYRIIQDPKRFCFGMDAVLLSAFAVENSDKNVVVEKTPMDGKRVLDMGTGTGILPILLAAKTTARELVGLEIQKDSAEMAKRSVLLNDLQDRIRIVEGDIKEAANLFDAASFDVITCNPPYMIGGHGLKNANEAKSIARHEVLCDFEDVASAAERLLCPSGRFFLVHRPFRLSEILVTLTKHKLEPKRMQLVYPFADQDANMVLIEAVRGGKSRMKVEKPMIIYSEPGRYTKELLKVYYY